MNSNTYFRAFKQWIPGAAMLTLITVFGYVALQQTIRQFGNDPQIQLSADIARLLSAGVSPASYSSSQRIDIAESLSPFVIILDESGKVVEASGQLHGEVKLPPEGVLNEAKEKGENRITWQPEPGVRVALVVTHYPGGFVLAGRSLRETERRINVVMLLAVLFWAISLILWYLFKIWAAFFSQETISTRSR